MPDPSGWILDLQTAGLSPGEWVTHAGGKGANLARLAQANLPVPNGFILSTLAYHEFVIVNQLQIPILTALPAKDTSDPSVLEESSARIRQLFINASMPPGMQAKLETSYKSLGSSLVAVRSSATAEDTLEFSFAGQQDTYLNIFGLEALTQAVIQCWSSLWTARAIGYRNRNLIPHDNLALAVVVQQMVQSEVSGVMFTANPLTGLRSEVVIDAIFGLGEAFVSGQVEPDQYLVNSITETIHRKRLGSKIRSLHGVNGGGTRWETTDRASMQALGDEEIIQLARLGKQVEALYHAPQDIEWAKVEGCLHLLQSRPITSLFPIPQGLAADPLKVMVSFAALQGLLAPITPLGRDTFRWFVVVIGQQMNMRLTPQTQTAVYEAGDRLWMNITSLIRNSTGRKIVNSAMGLVEPTVKLALNDLGDDPRLHWGKPGISWKTRRNLARFFVPLAGNVLLNLIAPAARRASIVEGAESLLLEMKAWYSSVSGKGRSRIGKVSGMLPEFMTKKLPFTFLRFVSGVAGGMASLNALNKLAESLPVPAGEVPQQYRHNLTLELTRGLPDNPTTEMDLALWQVARTIKESHQLLTYYGSRTPVELAGEWLSGNFDPLAAEVVRDFIDRYGARGLGEIDIGRARWSEDPTAVFEALQSYVKIPDAQLAPDAVFTQGEKSAAESLIRFTTALHQTRGGWIKAQLARFFASRMRRLLCIRESPKFFAVRMFNLMRQELLDCGRELAQSGELEREDDLFFLTYDELDAFSITNDPGSFQEIITMRRRTFELEQHRRQIPRLLLSDGRAFYAGIQAPEGSEDMIAGSPVSPGSTEGTVRVVLNPLHANLKPGEIMVCPGTDPSWTPLFLSAGGLIMEVGGMMTHGAVVAREYGIPAVVGVDQATTRLITGMRIRLDGSTGQIVILQGDTENIVS